MDTTPDGTLADPQEVIADLQRRLAEAEAREAATAEVLQVINASPGDLAPVFDKIVERAMGLCGAAFGTMVIADGEQFHTVSARGVPSAYLEFRRRNPVPSGHAGIAAAIRAGESVVHTLDLKDTDLYRSGDDRRRALVDLGGARTCLVANLKKDGDVLGAIQIYRQEVRPFAEHDITLLQSFAAQAVIAMENARLLTETREALEQQTATAEVLGVINSSPGDLAPVFDAILEKAMHLCDAAFGGLHSYDGEKITAVALRGLPPDLADTYREPWLPVPEGSYAQFLRGEPMVIAADIADPALPDFPRRRELIDIGRARTALELPLRKEDMLVGSIWFYRQEVRPFTEQQIALLQNFAAQAVIAMKNARLLVETRQRTEELQESLEYQIATSDVLKIISRATFDLQPVLDTLCKTAARLCDATSARIALRRGDSYRFVSSFTTDSANSEWDAIVRETGFTPGHGTVTGRALLECQAVHVADIAAYPDHALPETFTVGGIRTILAVPLLREDEPIGVVALTRSKIDPFTERQIDLVRTFADQAVIAIENARLLTETREALEQQTAAAEVLSVINSSPGDLEPVFDAMLERAIRLCDARLGSLVLCHGEELRAVATRGYPEEYDTFVRKGFPVASLAPIEQLRRGETVHVPDLLAHGTANLVRRAAIDIAGIRTVLLIPLRRDEALLGYISAFRQEVRPFSDKQVALLQGFAAQAEIALENARLLGELQRRTEEVAQLNRGLEARVAEQVDELGRVGRLKRFLAPQLAEMIVSHGDEQILESHRREIVVVFCDLRGSTAFTETAEPEEALEFLRQYHGALGPLVSQFEGTLDHFAGDGIMVFFNDPVPCPDPAERAVKMAVAMREAAGKLIAAWRRHGSELGFGVGIAQGYATLGQIGFPDHSGYTAIGTVSNLAARLCAEAKDGQILVSSRIADAVEAVVKLENLGNLDLKGLRRPVATFNVAQG
jgi:GAF domain-containing protein